MSIVELVVSEAKIWARGATTHWDVVPSVVLGSNGSDLVVGEPLTPPTQVVSAVQYLACDRIALPPRVPTAGQALSAVLTAIIDTLGVAVPCERIVVVHPTAWGARPLELFATAAQQFTHEVVFEACAVRASAVDDATRRSRRTVVVEFGMLSTTASSVVYDAYGTHVEAVEAEPGLAAAELGNDSGCRLLTDLLTRLLDDRPADVVQVFGTADPALLEAVALAAERACGTGVAVSPLSGADLARPPATGPTYTPSIPPDPAAEWMQPLRARAAATNPVDHRPLYLGAAALAAVVAAASIGGFFLVGASGDQQAAATSAPTTSIAPLSPATPPPSTSIRAPLPTQETVGSVVLAVPVGWSRAAATDPTTRAVLVPDGGARQRITVIQKLLSAGAGYDEVAADLEAQIESKPTGTVSQVRRDVTFAGRPGLSYEEHPADGSTVRWQVLVERGVQMSVGCQYVEGGWESVLSACEQVVGAARIGY
ncbi:type VII secretion-associated protein [Nocardia halotolerans]|uniref:Type VII secretion-associated protein n=1 Tax=Nocardia halotolerans TaxID=1755878 RepID=A0ABV8VN65_9NOCA